jgi:glucose-1-phosphate thymidylyltransferase
MKGIILAGGTGTRLWPITASVSKQLLPIYDKPLIFYSLSTLFSAQVRDVLIITTGPDVEIFRKLLGDGKKFGANICYETQDKPNGIAEAYLIGEKFLEKQPSALILGDNIFHGPGLGTNLSRLNFSDGARIFTYPVSHPEAYGVLYMDNVGRPVEVVEKPANPESNLAVTGLYFMDGNASDYAKLVNPSARGELEITSIINQYLKKKTLSVSHLPRGTAWLDTGSPDTMHDASTYVRILEERTGQKIGVPEEIAFRNGWIKKDQLRILAESYGKNSYSQYLHMVSSQDSQKVNNFG